MDIQSMDKVADANFDSFVAIHVLDRVANDLKALKEIHRALKSSGVALITIPSRENTSTEIYSSVIEHCGQVASSKFGVGTYKRSGPDEASKLFSKYFMVSRIQRF